MSAAGVGWKIYTGNWAGVLKQTTGILSEAVEKYGNKEMKNWIEAAGANSSAENKLEEFHQISKAKVNGDATVSASSLPRAGSAPST